MIRHAGQRLVLETAENIALEFELAGLASRFLAYVLDAIIQLAILLILVYLVSITAALLSSVKWLNVEGDWLVAALIIGIFLLYEGYFIFFETLWRGQSIGKRILGLRVIKDNGQAVAFLDVVIRNIMRFADMLPPVLYYPTYGLGSVVLMSNRFHKRIGDFAAGTLVVREKSMKGFEHVRSLKIHPDYLRQIRIPFTGRLSNDDIHLVREFFFRKNMFPAELRRRLGFRIATYISKRLKANITMTEPESIRFLDDLMLYLENQRQ